MRQSLACLSVLSICLTACAPKVDESAFEPAASEALSSGPALNYGVFGMSSVTNAWSGARFPKPQLAKEFIKGGRLRSAEVMEKESCAGPCDVIVLLRCSEDLGSGPARVQVLEAKTRKVLYESKTGGSCAVASRGLGFAVAQSFAPGTKNFQDLIAARGPAPAAAELSSRPSEAPPASTGVDRPSYRLVEDSNKFALVIGIENYSDLPPARFAENDARAVHDHLIALGYPERNIISLQGQKASAVAIKKYLDTWLPRNVGQGATVFVYYSGHGAPDPKSGEAYLVPWDGDPQFLSDTAYPVSRLYKKLGELKAKTVILALDACFSGAGGRSVLARGARPLVSMVSMGQATGNVVALTASGPDQISGALESENHGLFTYYFLKGLNGAAGSMSLRGLYDYLGPKVADEARRQNREQQPQLSGELADKTSLR